MLLSKTRVAVYKLVREFVLEKTRMCQGEAALS